MFFGDNTSGTGPPLTRATGTVRFNVSVRWSDQAWYCAAPSLLAKSHKGADAASLLLGRQQGESAKAWAKSKRPKASMARRLNAPQRCMPKTAVGRPTSRTRRSSASWKDVCSTSRHKYRMPAAPASVPAPAESSSAARCVTKRGCKRSTAVTTRPGNRRAASEPVNDLPQQRSTMCQPPSSSGTEAVKASSKAPDSESSFRIWRSSVSWWQRGSRSARWQSRAKKRLRRALSSSPFSARSQKK
mmetsp:Transcript_28866/g.96024  ORF Transcript_28866/g.96024 Transcript_28866/m.96024 type:complete len:244 (-) Transcript_28866:656-1387(-)